MRKIEFSIGLIIFILITLIGIGCSLSQKQLNKVILNLEIEFGLPIIKNVRIESPSIIIEVEYEVFLDKIKEIEPDVIYRIKSNLYNAFYHYYIFNEDMTIAYEYTLTSSEYGKLRYRFG